MGINQGQLRNIIQELLGNYLYSQNAEELLIATAAHETHLGEYIHQIGGPALGIFQMEPATEKDIWINYLRYSEILRDYIYRYTRIVKPSPGDLQWNLGYQILMARIHYFRVREDLPDASNLTDMAYYWKIYWNTPKGKGTVEEFIQNYNTYVKGYKHG